MKNILLLHGALGTKGDLEPLLVSLRKKEIAAHTFNFSGHGTRPFALKFGIEQFCDELLQFIDQNGIQNPFLFGYSMGGYVALSLALKHQKKLKGIVTLGTKFNWDNAFTEKETKNLNATLLLEKAPAFLDTLKKKHSNNLELLLQKTAAMMHELNQQYTLFADSLSQLQIPILITRGEKDNMVSASESHEMVDTIVQANYHEIANTKHAIETANTEILANVLCSFMDANN